MYLRSGSGIKNMHVMLLIIQRIEDYNADVRVYECIPSVTSNLVDETSPCSPPFHPHLRHNIASLLLFLSTCFLDSFLPIFK